ncbi:DUF2663 family protein [Bacillus sp. KH172YL63]|uniref:DUF2663 family protein n=1 Tax=Bacillus sp. KH172YL63 TaxID=2709784 RepID=UPI0013E49AA8|nr:DUF2663 family protein [Bacillus sp. KH172YL63]BCB04568.1 hypothetical protein KH172YL63_27010 [Bacillus sp. KH172YL63]
MKIQDFGEWTDQATGQMLHNLIEKKQSFEKAKANHLYSLWGTIFSSFFLLYYLMKQVLEPYSYSFAAMFSAFVSNSLHLLLMLGLVGLFGMTKILYEKKEKKEKEFHALRCEVIDRSKDLWKEDAWKKRHQVFEMLKKEWDINLFHVSK